MIFSEFEAGHEPCTSERAFLMMRGTPSIGARDWGNSPDEFPEYMLADLVEWAKLDKEIGAKLAPRRRRVGRKERLPEPPF